MRILADSKEGQKVRQVTVDGKPCISVVELDTEEGWVKVLVPKNVIPLTKEDSTVAKEDGQSLKWDTRVLYGHVEVTLNEE